MRERTCQAVRADGKPCGATALPNEVYCWAHSPTMASKRRAARQAGGYATARASRAQRLVPAVLKPVLGQLMRGLEEVHSGRLEAQKYSAMAAGASAIVKVFQLATLEERILHLERELGRDAHTGERY
jgi:hypothetical protein